MDKKIYVPSKEELYTMQNMDVNLYNYLLVKVVELLTLEGIKYKNKGILKNTFKYVKENPDIVYPICRMYPNEIQYSEMARNETMLCYELLKNNNNTKLYNLDNLVYFARGVTNNTKIVKEVIKILSKELNIFPQYRFEYKDSILLEDGEISSNKLLNDIFSCNYDVDSRIDVDLYEQLINIEPAYTLRLPNQIFNTRDFSLTREKALQKSVGNYAMRYGISITDNMEYIGKDILDNPDDKTKILIKCLKHNKRNIY